MTKCPGFLVYVRIVVESVGLHKAQENTPPVRPVGQFEFLGVGHVPKCLTGLGIETTRNAPQIIGRNYRHSAERSSPCLSDDILCAYLDGAIALKDVIRVSEHMAECATCAVRLRELGQIVELMGGALDA